MDAFVGEIRIFGFGFAPKNWAYCNGQTLGIAQNAALYSLMGNIYGGDGRSTFALPNLSGSIPMSLGQSPGGSNWQLGQTTGVPTVTLDSTQIAGHNHGLQATPDRAQGSSLNGQQLASGSAGPPNRSSRALMYADQSQPATQLNSGSLSGVGGGGAHNNMMPYLGMNFCICLQGIFPLRP